MAEITEAQAESMEQAYYNAELAVLNGQEYEIAGRMLKRANLKEIQEGREKWTRIRKRLSSGGGLTVRGVTPID